MIVAFGEYTITQSPYSKDKYWIKHDGGEGAEVEKARFEKLIHEFFQEIM